MRRSRSIKDKVEYSTRIGSSRIYKRRRRGDSWNTTPSYGDNPTKKNVKTVLLNAKIKVFR